MPKVTEAHLEARRQQVLEASAACFARNGFHQTSMQDICREAGLSAGAVYRYFRSKDEIIEAMCRAGQQQGVALIRSAQEGESTDDVLNRLADVFLPMVGNPTTFFENALFLHRWSEGLRNERIRQILQEGLAAIRAPFTEIIRRGQERGEVNPSLDPDAAARALVSLYHGLVIQTALGTQPDVAAYTAAAKAMVLGLIRQPPGHTISRAGVTPGARRRVRPPTG